MLISGPIVPGRRAAAHSSARCARPPREVTVLGWDCAFAALPNDNYITIPVS